MPSYQVNDGSESYGRNGSYNNYGYRQESSAGTAMRERDLDKPPAYNGNYHLSMVDMINQTNFRANLLRIHRLYLFSGHDFY